MGEVAGWVLRGRGLLAAVLVVGGPALAQPEAPEATEVAVALPPSAGKPAPSDAPPAVTGLPAPAKADPTPEAPAAKGEESVSDEGEPAAGRKEKVRVFGRIYARASADQRADYAREFDIPSARVGVRATFDFVEAEVMADLAERNNLLKDAFVRLQNDAKSLRLYGGRFKAPFLSRELESSWDLPLLERGLVADYLTGDTNQLGGRRLGVLGEVRAKGLAGLRVSAGIFQGFEDEDLDLHRSEDVSARVSVRPLEALTVGASTYVTEAFEGMRNWAGAGDATLRLGALRLSAEMAYGQIPLGRFNAQLGLLTLALPVGRTDWVLEPVLGAESLQLDASGTTARGHGVVGGLNLLLADRFKAQLQAERALRPGDGSPGMTVSLQLATRFY